MLKSLSSINKVIWREPIPRKLHINTRIVKGRRRHKLQDEFTTDMHYEILKNKQADRLSAYLAYRNAADLFGEERALEML